MTWCGGRHLDPVLHGRDPRRRERRAGPPRARPAPDGTEVDPAAWEEALQAGARRAGGLDDVEAIAVGGQQHGMVCLDATGAVVRPALLWNDTRSAQAAADLVAELGAQEWADAMGSMPVASFTVDETALAGPQREGERRRDGRGVPAARLADLAAARGLGTARDLADLVTDRSDASGTGYWSGVTASTGATCSSRAFGRADVTLPRVLGSGRAGGHPAAGQVLGPGAGRQRGRRARARRGAGRRRGLARARPGWRAR